MIRDPIRRTVGRSAAGRGRPRFIHTGKCIQGGGRTERRCYLPGTRSHTRDSVHIYTCLASAGARDLRKYWRAKEDAWKFIPPLPPPLSSRIIDPRGMGNGLSLAIACLPAELIYAHQPVSMFARTISLRTEHGHRLCLLQPLPPPHDYFGNITGSRARVSKCTSFTSWGCYNASWKLMDLIRDKDWNLKISFERWLFNLFGRIRWDFEVYWNRNRKRMVFNLFIR